MAALSEIVKNVCHVAAATPVAADSGGLLAPAEALQQRYESGETFRVLSAEELGAAGITTIDGTALAATADGVGRAMDRVVWMSALGDSQREKVMGRGRALPVKLVAYCGTQEKGLGDLATEVQHALATISRPESVYGVSSGIAEMLLRRLLCGATPEPGAE
eukprot:COSAG02_NODE_12142_length_1590_cov_1.853789_2_plen_162_part_00